VALPTFSQAAGSNDRRTLDALPLPALRAHAALVSVSMRPDADGQVRDMTLATVTAGTPRPSLSAYVAARSGGVDQQFPVDMAIDPGTVPRLSFVAVRDGRFDPAAVRGRDILIGATAIEMGDRYGTPRWGVLPGVVVQALAAETLLRGLPVYGSPWTPLLLAALIVTTLLSFRSAVPSVAVAVAGGIVLVAGVLLAQHRFLLTYPLTAALATIAVAAAASIARDVLRRFDDQRSMDEPTKLPNARSLLLRAKGDAVAVLAVAQIDNIDALRAVLGGRATADVLIRVAERLALIALDRAVYRTADNQLTFLLPPGEPVEDMLPGLRAILLQPVEVGGRRVDASISIGVATGFHGGLEQLLTDATLAADQARLEGGFWRRAATDLEQLDRSITLMGELDEAIAAGQIEVHYQPKYHLREQRIASVEALVRWRHPVRGFIGPDLFIPIAEQTNRIAPLTLHVLSLVVRDVTDWRSRHPDVAAAINISAKLLSAAVFNNDVERIIAAAAIPTASLIFEVTESAAMSDTGAAIAALRRYRDLGVAVSMDDYGTGQSTLTYLRQLPLSELKIDRSFVQFAHQNRDDGVLVRSTIELAHQLGLKVVAEGVEDAACLAFLEAAGCDLIQGYLISKPLPLPQLAQLLSNDRPAAA
ncbi:EAL domain-containing protein, partial [Sphingomonas bacterium]|uniref:EAL domain-containing protein n=1 Tax=Sphingomonas bacterium TaxID=1895847 RepID=UPI0015753875